MLGVRTNHHHTTTPTNDSAFVTHSPNGRTNFHTGLDDYKTITISLLLKSYKFNLAKLKSSRNGLCQNLL